MLLLLRWSRKSQKTQPTTNYQLLLKSFNISPFFGNEITCITQLCCFCSRDVDNKKLIRRAVHERGRRHKHSFQTSQFEERHCFRQESLCTRCNVVSVKTPFQTIIKIKINFSFFPKPSAFKNTIRELSEDISNKMTDPDTNERGAIELETFAANSESPSGKTKRREHHQNKLKW